MCGIAGIKNFGVPIDMQTLLHKMQQRLMHRGPDDQGVWLNDDIALSHTRLSIHDLSNAGHQPMLSASGRWIIVFNGEIYNYRTLREELLKTEHINFKSNSDTEVLVNAIDMWGIKKTLKKCIGMFAFSAVHIQSGRFFLARDRFGEKPLYYGIQNNIFSFSSELKSLLPLRSVGWKFQIDRDVLATYMRFGYVPTPYSIYKDIAKVAPGCYLEVSDSGVKCEPYWRAGDALKQDKFSGSFDQASDSLESKLTDTLKLQMCADVPLGAFLSGGVDSSLIVALMQSLSAKKINTFSIGFEDKSYDEAGYARTVAKYLGTSHADLYVGEKETLEVVPNLHYIFDEPFADSSQIPTYLVSKIAKSKVTVSLSGDGGDELFGGYNRYFLAGKVKSKIIDRALIKWLFLRSPRVAFKWMAKYNSKYALLSDKLLKLQNIIKVSRSCRTHLYQSLCSQIYRPDYFVLHANEQDIYADKGLLDMSPLSYQEWMMYADAQTYMIDDILTKVDRAAMALSLETRVPFLDHRIYEFAWSLPLEYKINNGVGKRILRDVLYRYVPYQLIERPKMGFGVPLDHWLRTHLKEWACALLNPIKMTRQGYLNTAAVTKLWQQHQSGKRNCQAALWTILMFQAWLENMHDKPLG